MDHSGPPSHSFVSELLRISSNLGESNSNSGLLSNSLAAAVSNVLSGLPNILNHNTVESLLIRDIGEDEFDGEGRPNQRRKSKSLRSVAATMGTISDVRALEHQTLKVPYEILNKKFRIAQKNIDREASHVQNSINDLEKAVKIQPSDEINKDPPVTVGKINELLMGVVNRLTVLKRKSIECMSEELEAVTVCKRRLEHLKEYCNRSVIAEQTHGAHPDTLELQDPYLANWKKQRMDRMLVDHCLRSGFYETAIQLARYSDIEPLTNIEIFLVCRDIEDSLTKHETSRCLLWCHDNRSKLRKIRSTLEFSLRQQEFIELVRTNQRLEAVKYAQKHFSTLEDIVGTSAQLELEQVMGLLACSPSTQIDRYRSFFDEKRWQNLVEQFRLENFKLYQLSNSSIFSITLQAGLSSLKTPQCYRKDGTRNSECPVCSELLNKLAVSLPCAHCSQSRLVCYMSGDPMNEHNQPMMLPNGYVYGEKALRRSAIANNGKVLCPRTQNTFDFKDAEKIMLLSLYNKNKLNFLIFEILSLPPMIASDFA
ncbi:hypothetical protein BLOT_015282 [Blomia tropicalis]|nr:hypothetical protein BLOT_015282 [Blomia tropicalis]